MNNKEIAIELVRVAKNINAIVDLPFPVSQSKEEEMEKANDDAIARLGKELTDGGHLHFWHPGHSMSVNIALTSGLNFWRYSIFGSGTFRSSFGSGIWDDDDKTIYINPGWTTPRDMGEHASMASYKWPVVVDNVIKYVKESKKIEDVAEGQLKMVEEKFKITIPNDVRRDIISYAVASAKRRLTSKKFPAPKGKVFSIVPGNMELTPVTSSVKVADRKVAVKELNARGCVFGNRIQVSELVSIAKTLVASEKAIDILREIVSDMRSKGGGEWRDIGGDDKEAQGEVRNWGDWKVPDDEEDDGDYDWKILTDKYNKIMNDIGDKFKNKYNNFDIRISGSEKNWLDLSVKKR